MVVLFAYSNPAVFFQHKHIFDVFEAQNLNHHVDAGEIGARNMAERY